MSKIIVRIKGGLGNQLFSFAAARRMALVNGAELVIDDVSGFVRDDAYKRHFQLDHFNINCRKATANERMEPFSRVRRFLKRARNKSCSFGQRTYIQQEIVDFDPRILHIKPRETLHLEGYWQSQDYFMDVEKMIRSDLEINPPADIMNLSMGSKIRNSLAVAVHVRFFDAPNELGGHNAPSDYYSRAVAQMEALVPGAHYFLFSDRADVARACIPLPEERITCVSHNQGDINAYADLWLMSQCRHFIIANSTFSWWGAWLACAPDKIVMSPDMDLTGKAAWGFKGLLPNEWVKL
jgi:hypothetical protein